ncbi:MAG: hypothetical protein U9R25_12535 [Chloroflexota bacterium]|nr:hypothetical protein [Chloroflexota bacterium]
MVSSLDRSPSAREGGCCVDNGPGTLMDRRNPGAPARANTDGPWPEAAVRAFLPFVYGWREVFVPLAVIAHSEHGEVLVTAALAVAAARLGTLLLTRYGSKRVPSQAGILAAVALLFLGLSPEEGPLSILLWLLFGLAWPVLEQGLRQRWSVVPYGLGWLVLAMAVAGPLALGPGTWLIGAGCLFLVWLLGQGGVSDGGFAPKAGDRPAEIAPHANWLPLAYSVSYLCWAWLAPALLLNAGLPVAMVGLAFAAAWLFRGLVASIASGWGNRAFPMSLAAAVLSIPTIVAMAWASESWQLVALMVLQGGLAGLVSLNEAIVPPQSGKSMPPAQLVGEVTGPLLGAVLLVIGGPTAVFLGAALFSLPVAGLIWRRRSIMV